MTVPSVIGLEEQDAIDALERENLKVKVTRVENEADEGTVFYQSISGNTEVPEGTTVSIKVSLGRAEPSPSPSPSETPTPTPTATPEPSYEPEPTETPTPSEEPTPTPSEVPPVVSGSGNITPDE